MNKHKNQNIWMLIIISTLMFVFFSIFTNTFLKIENIMSIMQKCVELGLLAIGMSLCIITGGINLSLPALCSFNTVIIALLSVKIGLPIVTAISAALAVSLLCGFLNGYLVAYKKVAPMLATLSTQALFSGMGLVTTGGSAVSGLAKDFTYIGNGKLGGIVPVQVLILIAIVVLMIFFTKYTRSGRRMYLVGTNSNVAKYSGINSEKTLMMVYILSSVMAFICAIIICSRLASGRPDVADNFLMQAIAASIFGGTSVLGGKGTITGCMLSVLALSILSNGLVQLLPSHAKYYEQVITGVLLIAVLTMRIVIESGKLISFKTISHKKNKEGVYFNEKSEKVS